MRPTPNLPLIDVPGGRVEFDDVPGSAPDGALAPLLFLHEGLGSIGLWRGFHRRIAAATGRRTVAYSRLGHGFSDPPPRPRPARFMHEEAEDVVPVVCDRLGLERPVLVGHSDGGSIALLHAAAADVGGLVVLAPHVIVEELGLRGIEAARTAFTDGDLRNRMARHHRDPDVTFWNWNDVWLSAEFRSWDIRGELSGITCRTLGVQGTVDPYGSVVHVEAVRDAAKGAVELLVLDCGHAPHLELPGTVERAVAGFVSSLG